MDSKVLEMSTSHPAEINLHSHVSARAWIANATRNLSTDFDFTIDGRVSSSKQATVVTST